MVASSWEEGKMGSYCLVGSSSIGDDEKVLEVNGGSGKAIELYNKKCSRWLSLCYVYFTTIFFL
jgi:hypothetical protein